MKTRYCNECKYLTHHEDKDSVCKLGHKPRFYIPKDFSDVRMGNFGYKRKCADFKECK